MSDDWRDDGRVWSLNLVGNLPEINPAARRHLFVWEGLALVELLYLTCCDYNAPTKQTTPSAARMTTTISPTMKVVRQGHVLTNKSS